MFVLTEQARLLLQDLKQDLLWWCPRFPEWAPSRAGPGSIASSPPEPQHQEPIFSHKTCICPNSRVLSAGLRSKGSVLCVQVCISFTQLSQPLSKEGWHWLHAGGAWRAGAKGNCDNWLLPCWKLKGLTDRTSSGYLWFKGHIMLPLRFVNLQGIDEVGQGHITQSTPLLISVL